MIPASQAKVLLIDDDERFLDVTARRLQTTGMTVYKARSWVDAIPHLRSRPHLALLDIRMATLSGEVLCSLLKKEYSPIRVLFYSSEPEGILRELAAEHGADGYLTKSADREELVEVLTAMLQKPTV
jgi:two-component system nitrate/nitrite response regulator NarL